MKNHPAVPAPPAPRVVVMGVAGCGKSTVGERIAHDLAVPFRDGDGFHPPQNVAKMRAGHPLDDDDRRPWLQRIGAWLAGQPAGAVVACSALRRSYRDLLREATPEVVFMHLAGPQPVAAARVAARPGHFMPASLVTSQYRTLEPLQPDEQGFCLDFTQDVDAIVHQALDELGGVPVPTHY